ncbi:hypothetical protein ACOCJ4_16005 [Knoellia sp. CPCC 206435]|uniref:hypothetical protein n=1 Tax=Knoellia terrae TaxID=3404797 RepID=UPI003B43D50B
MHPQTAQTPQAATSCPLTEGALFPPRDADAETFQAWLARAAWPEVVFGARLPRATAP